MTQLTKKITSLVEKHQQQLVNANHYLILAKEDASKSVEASKEINKISASVKSNLKPAKDYINKHRNLILGIEKNFTEIKKECDSLRNIFLAKKAKEERKKKEAIEREIEKKAQKVKTSTDAVNLDIERQVRMQSVEETKGIAYVKDYEVTDITKIPAEFLEVKRGDLLKAIRTGVYVEGIKVLEKVRATGK